MPAFTYQLFGKHRKYLPFCRNKNVSNAKCLGTFCAPRMFTELVAIVAAHLRQQNVMLALYLDDWLAELSKKVSGSRWTEMPKSVDFTRLYRQHKKVLFCSSSNNYMRRGSVLSRGGTSICQQPVKLNQGKKQLPKRFFIFLIK